MNILHYKKHLEKLHQNVKEQHSFLKKESDSLTLQMYILEKGELPGIPFFKLYIKNIFFFFPEMSPMSEADRMWRYCGGGRPHGYRHVLASGLFHVRHVF